jgi:hypothetical protein
MYEPFQGASIGRFRVLAPSREGYFQLVLQSDKTPQSVGILSGLMQVAAPIVRMMRAAAWGQREILQRSDQRRKRNERD